MQRLRLTLRPQSAQAEPGEQLSFALTIENSSSLVHDVTIRITGLQRQAYILDKATVSIPPGATTQVQLSVQPPTDAAIGRYPFRVQLTAEDDPVLRASSIADLVVVRAATPPPDLTTTEEGAARVAGHGQTDRVPSALDRAGAQAPSRRRLGRARPTRPLVAVLGLMALLGLLSVATIGGLSNRASPPAPPTRQPAARPTPAASTALATQQQPQGEVKGIVAHATPVTGTPRPTATATPFVITIGP